MSEEKQEQVDVREVETDDGGTMKVVPKSQYDELMKQTDLTYRFFVATFSLISTSRIVTLKWLQAVKESFSNDEILEFTRAMKSLNKRVFGEESDVEKGKEVVKEMFPELFGDKDDEFFEVDEDGEKETEG